MKIQEAINELTDYVGDVHKQTLSPDTVTMAKKALELQSELSKYCEDSKAIVKDFADKLIIEINEEKKFNPCRNTSCRMCPYTKNCYEGEQAHKVALDNIINVINKLVGEFITEGE